MTYNVARRAYSAEQLLALRRSASDEPALEMENKAEEGEIKGTLDYVNTDDLLPLVHVPHRCPFLHICRIRLQYTKQSYEHIPIALHKSLVHLMCLSFAQMVIHHDSTHSIVPSNP